jgi:hypothetical protein
MEGREMPIYRILSFNLAPPQSGMFMRVDDFEEHVTTKEEATACFNNLRKLQCAPNGARLILTEELDSF